MNLPSYFCSKSNPPAMRTILPLLLFYFGYFQTQAQISTLHVNHGCSYDDALNEKDLYLYDPSNEAERIVAEIVDALGLVKNFTVRSSNVSNALATSFNGTRYVFYSTSFLEKFKADANTQWAAYSVLAHEIGHHLNGHNFGETNPKARKMLELEADQFSGSVLRMLGATIEEAQAGLQTFDLQGETNTHPPTTARKEAVSNGWKKRDEWLRERGMTVVRKVNTVNQSPPQPKADNKTFAKEWYEKGNNEKTDFNKQIEYYTKAIQFDPNFSMAYFWRGYSKERLTKFTEALLDYDKSIQLNPEYAMAYAFRADLYFRNLDKSTEALSDINNAIRLDPNYSYAYYIRGRIKEESGKYYAAIADFDIAIKLDPNDAANYRAKGCLLVNMKSYEEAVEALNKSLQIDSTSERARSCIKEAYQELGKN